MHEVLVTLACLALMHHILCLSVLKLCAGILLLEDHFALLLHLHNLLRRKGHLLLTLLVIWQNEWICTIGHPSWAHKTRLLR